MKRPRNARSQIGTRLLAEYPFWTLLVLVVASFLFGGSGRSDVTSLLLLRPLAALSLAVGLIGFAGADIRRAWPATAFLGAVILLVAIHLVPLPPALWTALPGRELAAMASPTAGLPQPWRPITLVPWRGMNALYSLLVPAAAALLTLQCGLVQRRRLVTVLLAVAGASALLAIIQAIGGFQPKLYLYAVTNLGTPVGLFANRNHQAALLCCVLPMLAYFASGTGHARPAPWRLWGAGAAGLVTLLMLLATGSRAGLAIGVVALAFVPVLYRPPAGQTPDTRMRRWLTLAFGAAAIALVVIVALVLARASAVDRLLSVGSADEERFQAWGPIAHLAWQYFPVGSGIGSFVEVYKVAESNAALRVTYLNHAHNDWLEWLLEGGLPALVLMIVGVGGWAGGTWACRADFAARRAGGHLGLMAAIVMFLLGLASIVDYPLRTPALASLMAIASVLVFSRGNRDEMVETDAGPGRRPKRSAWVSSEGRS